MKIKVTATLVPPPEFIREGVKPTQFDIDSTIEELPEKLSRFCVEMLKTPIFHVCGSVAFLVQPSMTAQERKTALETGGQA